jgi:5-methyltetrahydropteroyltriglutamate--homocysteine methyltransferase
VVAASRTDTPLSPLPFRAEHIGSLLRPPALLAARQAAAEGRLSADALRAAEDAHIRDAVRLQEEVGLEVVTDGEYRRAIYFGHFGAAVSGFTEMDAEMSFRGAGGEPLRYRAAVVTGRLVRHRGIATDEFRFVRSLTRRTPKVTLPSPSSQHYLRWRPGVSDRAYPDLDEFFADVAAIYQAELADLAALGATYVQLDDVPLGLLCDPQHRAAFAAKGYDPAGMLDRYIALVNAALAGRPPGLSVGVHVCRGNNQGKWLGEGAYDYVAAHAFARLDVDAFFLEYDSPRAGGFEPLRHVAPDRSVVLGLVSTKTPVLEASDDLCRRIDAAARRVPFERLALSPQCGFASTAPGNPLSPAEQRRKLELVVDVARRVWG